MNEKHFDLVFKGEIIRANDIDRVKVNLAKLFKIDAKKVDALFAGKAVVLKRNLTLEAANKYRVAIKKAGARVDLVASTGSAESSKSVSAKPRVTPSLSLADAGVDLLMPSERKTAPPLNVDVSGLSIKGVGESLLNDDEMRVFEERELDLSMLDVAPEGAEVLRPEERSTHAAVDVDTSRISLADVGARLAPEAPEAPVAPDVSHISIEQQLGG